MAGRALVGKSIEVAFSLLEEMAFNDYHWWITHKRNNGKYKVDAMMLSTSMGDTLAQRGNMVGRFSYSK